MAGAPDRSRIVGLFVRHPNAANLVMVLMVLFGVFALMRLNTQFFPTAEIQTITITVNWPGASSEDVDDAILAAVEPEVRFLEGVDRVVSVAREGSAVIVLEFDPSTNMQKALSDVDSALAGITTMPENSERPKITLRRFYDRIAKISLSGPFSERALRVYAKKIRDDLIERGIDRVTFNGMRDEEIEVVVPERELRRLNLTVNDVAVRVNRNTLDRPSGRIDGKVERQIRAAADRETPQSLAEIEVKTFPSGERVTLGEIGTISRKMDETQARGFASGRPGIEIVVWRADTADTLKSAEVLETYLAELKPLLPPTLKLERYEARADLLLERIMLLVKNGATGLVLVIAVLLIFLNFRIAFWVAAGIPVAMMATLGVMYASGQTINMISLFGLLMTLGIIVDDAIVVGEHTATRSAAGDPPNIAAERGAGRMVGPVMAASLTTMAAFAPMFMISDVLGQMMAALPQVVIAVLIASLVECFLVLPGHLAHSMAWKRVSQWSHIRHLFLALLFLIGLTALASMSTDLVDALSQAFAPALSSGWVAPIRALQAMQASMPIPVFTVLMAVMAYLLTVPFEALLHWADRRRAQNRDGQGRFRIAFDRGFGWFRDGPFNWMVRLSFRWRYLTVGLAISSVIIFVAGNIMGGRVGFVFFPSPEAENIRASIEFNAGIPEDQAVAALTRIEQSLRQAEQQLTGGGEQLIVASFAMLGRSGRHRGDNLAEVDVQLTASEVRTVRTPEIVRAWRRVVPRIAGIKRLAIFMRRGGPPGRDIDIRLKNAPPEVLKQAAMEAADILTAFPGVSGVADDLPYGKPELVLALTPRGATLGFTVEDVGRQIRNAFEGAIARRLAVGDDEIVVRVSAQLRGKGSEQIRNLDLKSPAGDFVPLSEVVTVGERQVFSVIQRRDGKGTVSVTADVDDKITSSAEIIAKLDADLIPALAETYGVEYRFSGREEERAKAFADLRIGALIALAVIYIILAWVFASYWRPFAVMLIIPFGAVGALIGHDLMGFKLTIMSMISLLGLSGILVNDSIILVSRLDERLADGEPLARAAVGASRDRLRAVLLTSLTTIGGLTPLLFEQSLQAQFLKPMAITIVFGLAVATIWVLFLVPALVGIGGDIGRTFRALYGRREPADIQAAE